jgi:hypothetical protein
MNNEQSSRIALSAEHGIAESAFKDRALSEARDDVRIARAKELLTNFAHRTGIHASRDTSRRYLWTDAFAVQALLGLSRATGEQHYRADAFRLVDLVHLHLGTHRLDDPRVGWISGLDGPAGELHPTLGGLRIGKPLPERPADAPYDEYAEWERDGQYYHYLTRWLAALMACSAAGEHDKARMQYLVYARELAHTMHARFLVESWQGGPRRLHWKMSIDLTRPQVHASGLSDMLDGFATYATLETALRNAAVADPVVAEAAAELRAMCDAVPSFATSDPLALGGLLLDVSRLIQLAAQKALPRDLAFDRLVERLLRDIDRGLEAFDRSGAIFAAVDRRLAFRELGLALGAQSISEMRAAVLRTPALVATLAPPVDRLARHLPLVERIERIWLDPTAQATEAWQEHMDINEVMLATCLLPEVVLEIPSSALLSARCGCASSAVSGTALPSSTCAGATASPRGCTAS